MKESFYFSHDYNSRTDPKIKKLIKNHGMQGFGIFWAIIEDLYNNDNSIPLDIEGMSYDLRSNEDVVKSVIFDYNLFVVSDEIVSSNSVRCRLNKRNEKSIKASESAKIRWNKSESNAIALPMQSESNAIKGNKEKEIEIKKSKEDKPKRKIFTPPSINEIEVYFIEKFKSTPIAANLFSEKFFNYYQSNGWKVGGSAKMADWQAAINGKWKDTAIEFCVKYPIKIDHPEFKRRTLNDKFSTM